MRVVPVLDLKGGRAVHAIAGQRNQYRVVRGLHGTGDNPVALARALLRYAGTDHLYVADLDALTNTGNNDEVVRDLVAAGAYVWLDRGIRDEDDFTRAAKTGAQALILALETAPHATEVARWLGSPRSHCRCILSIDMRNGQLIADEFSRTGDIDVVVRRAVALGLRRLLLLDLDSVGRGSGPAVLDLGRRIRRSFPDLWLCGGGGVRDVHDLLAAHRAGFDAYLVATGLHTGKLDRHSLEYLRRVTGQTSRGDNGASI